MMTIIVDNEANICWKEPGLYEWAEPVLNRHLPTVAKAGLDFDTSQNCGNSIQPKVECSVAHNTNRRHESQDDDDVVAVVVAVAVFVVVDLFGELERQGARRREEEDGQTESKRRIFISGTVVNGILIHPT